MQTIRYYAYAATPDKKRIGLRLVVRQRAIGADGSTGRTISNEWTGRYWPNTRPGLDAAARRCARLNDGLARG